MVDAGGRRMVMPEVPARWLMPLEGRCPDGDEILQCLRLGNEEDAAGWSEERIHLARDRMTDAPALPGGHSRRALWLRIPLISARGVGFLVRPLERLTPSRVLGVLILWGVIVPMLPFSRANFGILGTGDWFAAAVLFLAGAVLHELGHAAALSAQGYPPGGIGAGVLFVIPVLHSDVSAITQLPVGGKLRVDFAGVAFQIAFGALMVLIAGGPGRQSPVWLMAGRMSYFAVVWNLIPFIRADGYWALCDALGFRDLDRRCEVAPSRPKLVFLLIHRVLNIVFLIFVAVVLPIVWAGRLAALVPVGLGGWTSVIAPGLVLLLWGFMARRIFHLIGVLILDGRLWNGTQENIRE